MQRQPLARRIVRRYRVRRRSGFTQRGKPRRCTAACRVARPRPTPFVFTSVEATVVMLLLVFLMLFLGLFALFLGGGLVAQGYLYQQPVERLPLRAIVAAVLV